MDAPDIILVFPDQWRGDCLGHLGHPLAVTPYIDQLATEGVSFRRAYSPSPTCVPARACLATGLRPWNCGRVGYRDHQPWPYRATVMQRLQGAGYQTVCVGKTHFHPMRLHLGFEQLRAYEASVREPGYDSDYHRWLRHETGGRVLDPALERNPNALPVEIWEHEERLHNTRWTADQALEVLATRDPTRPLFMQLGFHRPHVPFDPPRRHYELLRERALPPVPVGDWAGDPPVTTRAHAHGGRLRDDDLDAIRYAYHAQLAFIDEQLGRLLRQVEQRGRETWIVFTSDHGELLGDHHRMFKGCFYEGSARVPLVVRPPRSWSGARGVQRDELVDLCDLLPTCCGLAGIAVEPAVDGRDLAPLLGEGTADWRHHLHGEHHASHGEGWQAIIGERYKYLWEAHAGREQLFDLAQDPQELRELAADPGHAALVAEHRALLVQHLADRGCGSVVDGDLVAGHRLPPAREAFLQAASTGASFAG